MEALTKLRETIINTAVDNRTVKMISINHGFSIQLAEDLKSAGISCGPTKMLEGIVEFEFDGNPIYIVGCDQEITVYYNENY